LGLELTDFTGTISADNGLFAGAVTLIGGDPGTPAALFFPNKVAYDNVVFPALPAQLVDGNGILMELTGGTLVAEINLRGPGAYTLYVGDSAGAGSDLYTGVGLTFTLSEVPEPASAALLTAGLSALATLHRRRRSGSPYPSNAAAKPSLTLTYPTASPPRQAGMNQPMFRAV
jgi:hypothetical protein